MIPLPKNPLYALSQDAYDYALSKASPKFALDIGANEGGYTATLLQHGYMVKAFEPVPDVFARLQERYKGNPRVDCINAAVSDKNGRLDNVTVLVCWTLGSPKTVPMSVCPSYKDKALFSVNTVCLDDIPFPHGGVGIIKLDVDGYEMKVLQGARRAIAAWKPPILCEFSGYIEKIGTPAQEFVNFIFSLGYHIFSMDGKRRFTTWAEVAPCYPHDTSFDVMLFPVSWSDAVLKHFAA